MKRNRYAITPDDEAELKIRALQEFLAYAVRQSLIRRIAFALRVVFKRVSKPDAPRPSAR